MKPIYSFVYQDEWKRRFLALGPASKLKSEEKTAPLKGNLGSRNEHVDIDGRKEEAEFSFVKW